MAAAWAWQAFFVAKKHYIVVIHSVSIFRPPQSIYVHHSVTIYSFTSWAPSSDPQGPLKGA